MIFAALYVTFLTFTATTIHSQRSLFAKFPHGKRIPRLLIATQLTIAIATVLLSVGFFPSALIYPVPVFSILFIFPIVFGKKLTSEYQTYGTCETAPLESICTNVMWSGIFGLVYLTLATVQYVAART